MGSYPPQYPPPGPPYDWRDQRRMMREQVKMQREQMRFQRRMARRYSILGPITMVLIGVIFLLIQTGKLQADHFWSWYGQWWPLLLVFAGVVLLVEWAVSRAMSHDPQQPYARPTLSAGVITLLILFTLTGFAVSAIRRNFDFFTHKLGLSSDNMQEFLGEKHESDQSLSQTIPSGAFLSVDNPRGDVTISGTSTDGQLHLALHKEVYSRSDSDAENTARSLVPSIDTSGNNVTITMPTMHGAQVDLDIMAPANSVVTVNANHGDLHARSFSAPLKATANHGDLDITNISASVLARINSSDSSLSIHGVTGPVSVEGKADDLTLSDITGPVTMTGEFFGTSHLEHISNSIRFHTSRTDFQLARLDGEIEIANEDLSANRAAGPVVLNTRNRNITLERISGDLSVTNRNGTIDLVSAPPLGNVMVQNRNGAVNLTLPEHANFVVKAETSSDDDINNDFSLSTQDNDHTKSLNATVGKGGPSVQISTSQGDISLKKSSVAPLPAAPPSPPLPPTPLVPDSGKAIVNIRDEDGSSFYAGKDGLRITSRADGSSFVTDGKGLKITKDADGSSFYQAKDGTKLTIGADGGKTFLGSNGMSYTESVDGSKMYRGSDGTRITIGSDGSHVYTSGSNGKPMTDQEVREHLRQAEEAIKKTSQERDRAMRETSKAAHRND